MKKIFFILSVFCLSLYASDSFQLYRILNPDRSLVNQLESRGAVIERYHPNTLADVYMPESEAAKLTEMGFTLQKIFKEKTIPLITNTIIDTFYHSYEGVTAILDSLVLLYPEICRLTSLGQTIQGREIWAVKISANPDSEEVEPEINFIGAMHGNEVLTQELMLFFIDDLLKSYSLDERVQKLIDSTEIWVVPSMNYDGIHLDQRWNANEIDLNRNFPDREFDLISDTNGREPETRQIMTWSENHSFVLAANFHSGAQVVNYPWDKNIDGIGYAACPDDAVFK